MKYPNDIWLNILTYWLEEQNLITYSYSCERYCTVKFILGQKSAVSVMLSVINRKSCILFVLFFN